MSRSVTLKVFKEICMRMSGTFFWVTVIRVPIFGGTYCLHVRSVNL